MITWKTKLPLVAPRPPPQQPPQPPKATGRRRKFLEVPCCEKCDGHYLRIRDSEGNIFTLECRECGHQWKDDQREIIHAPRRPRRPSA